MFILKWRFRCLCRSSFHLLPSKSETILNKTLRINLVVLLTTMTLFFFRLSKISCFHILAFSISPLFWEGQADGDEKVSVLYVSRLDLSSLSLFITTEVTLVTWPPAMQRKGKGAWIQEWRFGSLFETTTSPQVFVESVFHSSLAKYNKITNYWTTVAVSTAVQMLL